MPAAHNLSGRWAKVKAEAYWKLVRRPLEFVGPSLIETSLLRPWYEWVTANKDFE
jgi:hypothetical protein